MKLEVNFSGLEKLREKIGARKIGWIPDSEIRRISEIEQRLAVGIEGDLTDISKENGGLLSKDGLQVVLYIKDHSWKIGALNNPEEGNRVHLSFCSTLQDMWQKNRKLRYVRTSSRDGYTIEVVDGAKTLERKVKLYPCINCLNALNYKGFLEDRGKIREEFDANEFFSTYSTFFAVPSHYADYASPSVNYVKDWSIRSQTYRESRNWTCEQCKSDLSNRDHRKYLHVHHKNGVKAMNTSTNLIALCAMCHRKQPYHGHMKVTSKAEEICASMRPKLAPST